MLSVLPLHHWNTAYSCHTFHFLSPSASAKHLTLAHKLNVLHYATRGQPVFCLTFSLSYLSLWQVLDLNPCSQAKCSIIMLPGPSYLFALHFHYLLMPGASGNIWTLAHEWSVLPINHWTSAHKLSVLNSATWLDSNPCSWIDCSIIILGPSYILAFIFTIFLILVSLAPNPCSWLNCYTIMQPGPSYLFASRFHYFP